MGVVEIKTGNFQIKTMPIEEGVNFSLNKKNGVPIFGE
jgi:hypothetical protein